MNELATTPQRMEVEHAHSSGDPMDIMRFAIEKGSSVETIERLMVVRKELMAEKAKSEYDAALAAFQSECPVVSKQKDGASTGGRAAYRYAPFEDIVSVVKPFLMRHGFSYQVDTDVSAVAGWVVVKVITKHRAGHSEILTAKFPLGQKTGIMSDTQVYAGAMTFAVRRTFCNAFGIVTSDEDMDGRLGRQKPQGPSSVAPADISLKDLAKELWKTLAPVRGAVSNWDAANQWMWDENVIADTQSMPDMTADEIRAATLKAKAKLA